MDITASSEVVVNAIDWKAVSEIAVNFADFFAKAGEALIAWMIFWWGWKHIRPVVKRLGVGLRKRRIYIISDENNKEMTYQEAEERIKSAKLFEEDNIKQIDPTELNQPGLNLRKFLEGKSLLIYIYPGSSVEEDKRLEGIINNKETAAGLIVLAAVGSIPTVKGDPNCLMAKVSRTPNTVVVNAQGRMLNDLLNLMMTTDFQKKGFWATLLDE